MIFKQWQQVLDGTKTQTRRPRKDDDKAFDVAYVGTHEIQRIERFGRDVSWNRTLFEIGRTYAVQPGFAKKSVGRIRITKIRRETLWKISRADAVAEGLEGVTHIPYNERWLAPGGICWVGSHLAAYRGLWNSIYGPGAWERMKDDDVWALTFEAVETGPGRQ